MSADPSCEDSPPPPPSPDAYNIYGRTSNPNKSAARQLKWVRFATHGSDLTIHSLPSVAYHP
eukprot:366555-Prorocentrum_minimum.AAC.1